METKEWFVTYEIEVSTHKILSTTFIYGEDTAQDAWDDFNEYGEYQLVSIFRV
mgnify:CR=1 FL=1